MNSRIKQLVSVFNLKDIEEQLFAHILENGAISATELARETNITRTSVYDYLTRLREGGLVTQTLKNGIRKFSVEPEEKIQFLISEKEKTFRDAKDAISIISELSGKKSNLRPLLQMFEGRAELQQMMKDMLLYKNITVCAYWPIFDVIKLLTPKFMEDFHRERIKRNIKLKTIWPTKTPISTLKQFSFLKSGIQTLREVRLAPGGIDFSLGYTIYENKVRFISSSHESFGFIISSNEFAQMMRGQFDAIWSNSKQIS